MNKDMLQRVLMAHECRSSSKTPVEGPGGLSSPWQPIMVDRYCTDLSHGGARFFGSVD